MSRKNKNVDDLHLIGRSVLSSFQNDLYNSKDFLIHKRDNLPFTNCPLNCELKTYRSLKALNEISQQINSLRYEGCDKPTNKSIYVDVIAEKYFPITLSAPYEIEAQMKNDNQAPWTMTFSPPPNGLPRPKSPWRAPTRFNKNELNRKWLSTEKYLEQNLHFLGSSPLPLEIKKDIDQMMVIQTPYQAELTKLRLDRLRLEDEILMEVKKQDELERIRGPEAKWYELKDATFHYEAKKNNSLLKNIDYCNKFNHYSDALKTKSKTYMDKNYDPTNYIPVS